MGFGLRYMITAAVTMVLLCAFVIALGIFCDPYRMFGTYGLALKPRAIEQSEIAKTYMLGRVKPRTLLLGNSRVEIGLDPDSARWPRQSKPVFDAAEAGRGLFTARLFLQDDLAMQPPRLVIVGADYPDFLSGEAADGQPPVEAQERRMLADRDGKPVPGHAVQFWRDFFASTLTIDAVYDSIVTILEQGHPNAPTMTESGYNPLHEYRDVEHHEGYGSIFAQKQEGYVARFRSAHPVDFSQHPDSDEFRQLAAIVHAATDRSVNVIVFVNPYHAVYLEMLHRLGYWQSFESWKRTLVKTVAEAAGKHADLVRIYDFSGYNPITTEAIPALGDKTTEMAWYWESGHYKNTLGDVLISSMMTGRLLIGSQIDVGNVDQDIQRVRLERAAFLRAGGGP